MGRQPQKKSKRVYFLRISGKLQGTMEWAEKQQKGNDVIYRDKRGERYISLNEAVHKSQ